MTEAQIAWELESHMRFNGAEEVSFPIIVGSGPNGAMPHATCSDRPVQVGEPIVVDWGATVHGYRSDATRTLCLGAADDRYLQTWHLVLDAQRAVEERVRPGMSGKQVDAIARDVFAQAGQAERFGHGLWHGVGLAIHEAPFLGTRFDQVILEPGMVFSVEPGLYYPGWGGVRIEDLVVLREHGAEVLTQALKEPVIAG
jgi:Xaa-Pro aminopeptidase